MKHVKKSMFISTVLMVVMLIAALSTATFAWYTSNSTASSTATQVGAAESSAANIGIGFYKGATSSTITFKDILDGNNKGDLFPTVPLKFYEDIVKATPQTQPAVYSVYSGLQSNIDNSQFIANAFEVDSTTYDYLRIINMTSGMVDEIVDASDYYHSFNTDNLTAGTYTNLSSSIGNKYEQIYRVVKYAIKNDQASSVTNNTPISVSAAVYSFADENTAGKVYGVIKSYLVNNTQGTDYEAFDFSSNLIDTVTQSCAYTLTGNLKTPNEGSYIVAYYDYNTAAYTADLTKIDTNAELVGYAAEQADALNAGDILESTVKATAAYGITDFKYDSENFAYLYKTSNASDGTRTDLTKLTNAEGFANFKFNKASMDADGYFASNGVDTKVGAKYSGSSDANYNDVANRDIALITGIKSDNTYTDTFYVTNNGSSAIANLRVSLTTSGDNKDLIRLALFKDGDYIGTMAGTNAAPTAYGQILQGAAAKDMKTYEAYSSINLGALQPGNTNAAEFQIVVWFDGKLLDDATAGGSCSFTLNFAA